MSLNMVGVLVGTVLCLSIASSSPATEYFATEWICPLDGNCLLTYRDWEPPQLHPAGCGSPTHVVCKMRTSRRCHHFAHAAQGLLPCWSMFQRFAHLIPVIGYTSGSRVVCTKAKWTRSFISMVNASVVSLDAQNDVVDADTRTDMSSRQCSLRVCRAQIKRPPVFSESHTELWVSTSSDLHRLSERILGNVPQESLSGNLVIQNEVFGLGRLRIGFLNRKGTRRMRFIKEIVRVVKANQTGHIIDVTTFEDKDFLYQARWMHAHDIVIAPHGAQNTNFAFLRNRTAVAEIYPKSYYVPGYYLSLARANGAYAMAVYPGRYPWNDTARTGLDGPLRKRSRSVNIDIGVQDALCVCLTLIEVVMRMRGAVKTSVDIHAGLSCRNVLGL
mmetsp:Transcript_3891/g.11221  ORF Transcript_3891/g.11221 Transcript_3891/m.11221 type:complete len:387 (+) Transcript_3891:229-1389(+)